MRLKIQPSPNSYLRSFPITLLHLIIFLLLRNMKRQFHSSVLENIEHVATNNPKEYWKLVNSIKKVKNLKIMKYRHLSGNC